MKPAPWPQMHAFASWGRPDGDTQRCEVCLALPPDDLGDCEECGAPRGHARLIPIRPQGATR